jgi:hypothetical protein
MIILFSVALAISLALALASTSLAYAQIPAVTLPNGTLLTFNNLTAVYNYYAQKEGEALMKACKQHTYVSIAICPPELRGAPTFPSGVTPPQP